MKIYNQQTNEQIICQCGHGDFTPDTIGQTELLVCDYCRLGRTLDAWQKVKPQPSIFPKKLSGGLWD